jgi:predicted ATPase/class 3 adenylate cyclase
VATRVELGTPSARPSGTVTFLFSDIEGSTERWERDRNAMAAAVARHDTLLRAMLESHGGYIFKTVGDAFCAAFSTAGDAITAALDAQRALVAEDFSSVDGMRVRIALHTGAAEERDGDYFGPAVNRIARLLAIGHGGQVLLSGAAAELLQGDMPPRSNLRDLGGHRLKDLSHPEHVYQLIAPDLPETFPPLRSLDVLPNNLPRQLTSFVGRDDVMADVVALIEKYPLVTLVGTGGAGKTRCAIQIGAELLDGSGDGVWLAELAPISDSTLVPNAVAQALNLQEQPNRPALDTLVAYLKRKHLLLILDNCEHVIDEVRRLAGTVLRQCPHVRILATSREPLNIASEATYRMPSLGVPSTADVLFAEGPPRYGAVQLFIDRAMFSNNRFSFTQENAPHVVEICRRLDGLPLAIELAAARVKVLSAGELAQKLDERFRVLTGGDRSELPRHQTMRALIDWSYDLLSNDERVLLKKVSIFAGGFTLQTAAAVCGDDCMDEIAVLDLLSSLVDKSLIQAESVGKGTRYRLLESTRQYTREKLNDAEYAALAQAHARAFLALAERLDEAWEATPDRTWLELAEPELDNFRSALAWTLGARGDVLMGQRLAGALRKVWFSFSAGEGMRWVKAAQECAGSATPIAVLAALDLAEAHLAAFLSLYTASYAAGERALARYREANDPVLITDAQLRFGNAMIFMGKIAEAEVLLQDALAKLRARRARKSMVFALDHLANARQFCGDLRVARDLFDEALAVARTVDAERLAATIAGNLGELEFRGGNAEAAERLAREMLGTCEALHDMRTAIISLNNQSAYLVAMHRYDEARLSARKALGAARDTELPIAVVIALQHLAAVAALRQTADALALEGHCRAACVLGYADARYAALRAFREYTELQEYDRIVAVLGNALGEDRLAKLMAEGSAWSEDQAVAEAMRI